MAVKPGKENRSDQPEEVTGEAPDSASGGTLNTIPELMRRVVALGLSGLFVTEEAIRKAFGDTVPKDWTDFAVEQSDRTRSELLDRLSAEIGRSMDAIDVAAVLADLLEGRTIEVKAEFRIKPDRLLSGSNVKIAAKDH